VDYGDPRNWSLDPAGFFNRNPLITPDDFLLGDVGIKDVHFGLIIPDAQFTTGAVLDTMKHRMANLAETLTYFRECPAYMRVIPTTSFCGLVRAQEGILVISYVHADRNGLNLFRNWMDFRRPAGSALLVVTPRV